MNLDHARQKVAIKLTLLTFVVILLATIFRPLVADQSVIFTYIGLFNTALSGALYFYLATCENKPWHPYLILTVLLIILLPATAISGGVNSQFTPIYPLVCILMCLIVTPRMAWGVMVLITGVLVAQYFAVDMFPNYAPETVSESKSIARLFWLVLACVLASSFGLQFDRINSSLGSRLVEQARLDGLTGVLNRSSVLELLDDNLEAASMEQRWLSVIMLDLDHLKSINEIYGHVAGDLCLRKVAGCLKHHIRDRDDLVGRYLGEQFILVMMDVDQGTAMKIAEKIRLAIKEMPIGFEGEDISLSATLGYCSMQGDHIHSKEQFLQAADQALLAAKEAGHNRVVGAEQSIVTSIALA